MRFVEIAPAKIVIAHRERFIALGVG